jgi:hypothetical protein
VKGKGFQERRKELQAKRKSFQAFFLWQIETFQWVMDEFGNRGKFPGGKGALNEGLIQARHVAWRK